MLELVSGAFSMRCSTISDGAIALLRADLARTQLEERRGL